MSDDHDRRENHLEDEMRICWRRLWSSVAATDPDREFDALEAAYAEKHRAYHNLEHVNDCLREFDAVSEQANRPDEVELALWFHDVVYSTRSNRNEEDSADWAAKSLRRGAVAEESVERVRNLVLATRHDGTATTGDEELMVDADLSILGRPLQQFRRYEDNIRSEYAWVPGPLFRRKRRSILKGFLARPSIYRTESFRSRYESQARTNLDWAVRELGGG